MPIYDFKCPKCSKTSEELVLSMEAEVLCEDCRTEMKREFPSGVSFRMTDNFIMGREKPQDPNITAKLESFEENPSSDPYGKYRD